MKPREELAEDIGLETLECECGLGALPPRAVEHMMRDYAIGKWVSVKERLPEFKGGYWSGHLLEDGRTEYGIRSEAWFKTGNTSHWLELDLPEVSQ